MPQHAFQTVEDYLRLCGLTPNPQSEIQNPQSRLGSPCARSWDEAWVGTVEDAEARLGRRICGARTVAGTPCELEPNHENGRCRFHGGFALTGAPKGNRNAVVHGLYSRRLKVCGPECPIWDQCPCAGDDVVATDPKQRPTCPYEQTEYNMVLTDALARLARDPNADALTLYLAHNLALLQVMVNRAAIALRNSPMVDEVQATGEAYAMQSSKLSAGLQAFLRLSSEYRRYAALLEIKYPHRPEAEDVIKHAARSQADPHLDPDAAEGLHPEHFDASNPDYTCYLAHARNNAANGLVPNLLAPFKAACTLAPAMAERCVADVLEHYDPKKGPLRKDALAELLQAVRDGPP